MGRYAAGLRKKRQLGDVALRVNDTPARASFSRHSDLMSVLDRPLQKQAEKIDTDKSYGNYMLTIWTKRARKQSGARKERIYTDTCQGIPHLERPIIGC